MRDVDHYYYGSFHTALDEAGRMNIPRRIRETMDRLNHSTWYITPGLNGNLYLYSRDEWGKILSRNLGAHSSMNQRNHQFFSFSYGLTAETRVDRQGRMPIPMQIRESLGIEREVVLVGAQDRLELWNKSAWDEFCRNLWPQYGQRATELAAQNGSGSEKGGKSDGDSAEGNGTGDGVAPVGRC